MHLKHSLLSANDQRAITFQIGHSEYPFSAQHGVSCVSVALASFAIL
jgi:hypothetical protein